MHIIIVYIILFSDSSVSVQIVARTNNYYMYTVNHNIIIIIIFNVTFMDNQ